MPANSARDATYRSGNLLGFLAMQDDHLFLLLLDLRLCYRNSW
jgi:hypothetical protein